MRCSRVRLLIDDHVDGLLPAADAESVRDHMDGCRDCRDAAFAARAASTSLAAWGDHEPPAACFDQILLKIRTLPPDAIPRPASVRAPGRLRAVARRWSLPSVAAAAAVVAGFVVVEKGAPSSQRRVHIPSATAYSAVAARTGPTGTYRALRPGEEYVHLAPDRHDDGVRRVRPQDFPGAAVPIEASLFGTPR